MGSKNSVVSTPLPLDVKNDRYQEYAFIPFDVLQGTERISLHTYRQTPPADLSTAAQHKQAVVIILHGLSQHLGNSAHIARDLSRSGYVVCGYDHRGFGLSEGVRGYIYNVDTLVQDAVVFTQKIRELYPNKRVFLCGESLGGLVSYQVALYHRELVDGVILMNAALGPTYASARFGFLAKGLGYLFPRAYLLPRIWGYNSKNPLVERYLRYEDPYYYRERARPGTLSAIAVALEKNERTFAQFDCPCLIIYGGKDFVVDERHANTLSLYAKTKDKKLLRYQNLWHCSWLEEEIVQIVPAIVEWLDAHTK